MRNLEHIESVLAIHKNIHVDYAATREKQCKVIIKHANFRAELLFAAILPYFAAYLVKYTTRIERRFDLRIGTPFAANSMRLLEMALLLFSFCFLLNGD